MPPLSKVIALPTRPSFTPVFAPGGVKRITISRAGLWLPCATPVNAPLPSSCRPSGPRPSAVRCSASPAIPAARAARPPGGRPVRPLGDARRAGGGLRHLAPLADEHDALERMRPALRCLPAAGLVGAEHRALDDRAGLLRRRQVERGVEEP